MGIEPTSRRVSDDSTPLKAAGQSAQPVQSQALSESAEADYTKNDTKDSEITPRDAELEAVIEVWSELPEAVRAGILAMVKAVKP